MDNIIDRKLVYKVNEETFKKIVKESSSYTDICKRIGISKRNNNSVKLRVEQLKLNTQHFRLQKLTKEQILEFVNQSTSYQELFRKSRRTHKYMSKLLKEYDISCDHFHRNKTRNIKENITKEQMAELVNSNKTIGGVLIKLKLPESLDNYIWLRKICKDFKINIDKIEKIKWKGCKKEIERKVKNIPYAPYMRQKLIESNIKENKCESCGQLPMHNNKPLILQCHHIDGNRANNKFDNLQILCPNCHSQTDNFARTSKFTGQTKVKRNK